MLLTETQYADFVRFLNDIVRIESLQRNDGFRIVDIFPKSDSTLDSVICSAVHRTIAAVHFGQS